MTQWWGWFEQLMDTDSSDEGVIRRSSFAVAA